MRISPSLQSLHCSAILCLHFLALEKATYSKQYPIIKIEAYFHKNQNQTKSPSSTGAGLI